MTLSPTTCTRAFLLTLLLSLMGTGFSGSPHNLSENEIVEKHRSLKDRSCDHEDGVTVITGNGEIDLYGVVDMSLSVNVCTISSSSSDDGKNGNAIPVSGKIFHTGRQRGTSLASEAFYHAHCMFVDEDGGTFIGVETEDLTGSAARHMNEEEEEVGKEKDGMLAATAGGPRGGEKSPRKLPSKRSLKKDSKKSGKTSKCPKSVKDCSGCCVDGECCDVCRRRGLNEKPLWDAKREVVSGNEASGTLAIFYYKKNQEEGNDNSSNHQHGMIHHVEFDTNCSDFVDAVHTYKIDDADIAELVTGELVVSN